MKIKMTLRLLFSFIPALVFPLTLTMGTLSFVQPSFAKNCHFTSPAGISTSIDVFEREQMPIIIPTMEWTCERDIPLKSWVNTVSNHCYRIEPVGSQIRDNYSFNLTMKDKPDIKLGFKLYDYYLELYLSINDSSLETSRLSFNHGEEMVGRRNYKSTEGSEKWASEGHMPSLEVRPLLDGIRNLIQPGTYAGKYIVWMYQEDDVSLSKHHNCVQKTFTSKSALGTIDLSITIKKNCLLGNKTDINFGTMESSLAMKQPEAEGNISIRCTNGTPYSITFNQGRNSVDGKRQMKSADGKSVIPYELCADRHCKSPWTNTPIQIGQGEPMPDAVTTPIYARIPKLPAAPSAGIYTDTVVYTITY